MYAHSSIVGETAISVCTLPKFIDKVFMYLWVAILVGISILFFFMLLSETKNSDIISSGTFSLFLPVVWGTLVLYLILLAFRVWYVKVYIKRYY